MTPDIDIAAVFEKFDRFRADLLPTLIANVQAGDRDALIGRGAQWEGAYGGPQGYLRLLEVLEKAITQGHGPLPVNELIKRRNSAENALLDMAESFMAELSRLALRVGELHD